MAVKFEVVEVSMDNLREAKCEVCRVGAPPAKQEEIDEFLAASQGWEVVELQGEPQLRKVYRFGSFREALAFTNRVGEAAEAEGHHPAILTEWGMVTVRWWTHKIGNIHRNDLIMAAKSDALYEQAGRAG